MGSTPRLRRLAAGAALLVSALSLAPGAAAAGGTAIAGAPTVRVGVAETVDTLADRTVLGTDGSEKTGCWKDFEYWRLPLAAGDAVSITGRGNGASGFLVGVFPTSTTDANIRTTGAIANGKVPNSGPLQFSASSTGTYTVTVGPNCHDGDDGEFSFTVAVTHGAVKQKVVALLDHVARIPLSGVVTAVVRAPDKTAIHDPKLVLKLVGTWKDDPSGATTEHVLASSPAREGAARFRYRLPSKLSGATVQLKLSGGGGDYQPVTTRPLTVTVG
jgi:hypothetical protein